MRPGPNPDQDEIGVYDPRVQIVEDRVIVTPAVLTHHGDRAYILETEDFLSFRTIDKSTPDNRNVVLFPERIDGLYWRLERPFPIYSRDWQERFDIWVSCSPDMRHWGQAEPLLCVEDVPFSNMKLGAGSAPVLTEEGWLVLFHAVDEDESRGKNGWEPEWLRRYTIGGMLIDPENLYRVRSVAKSPLLVPEANYETKGGFRNDVLFPGALIIEDDGAAKVYYGAADTVECLAESTLAELVDYCLGR
ncbi:MAG: hypothetical protein KIT11_09415 [Fimbriimonadaceae bacterium]|nr:hypothetical protein [Fimbriimonadaceae bacterium]QYK57166.1 MAG: hypothetical protein KF733_11085 [Fimbriimonadaceae bacterium]